MYEDRRLQALEVWHKLLNHPETRMNAEEQYEELLRLAEEYSKQGFIDQEERKQLVMEATKRYALAVEGVGGGT
jgi:lipopolysaccharide biosynthesis regulator YciM